MTRFPKASASLILGSLLAMGLASTPAHALEPISPQKAQEHQNACSRNIDNLLKGVPPAEAQAQGWTERTIEILFETLATADDDVHIGQAFIQNVKDRQPELLKNARPAKAKMPKIFVGAYISGSMRVRGREIAVRCEVRDYGDGPFLLRINFARVGKDESFGVPVNPKPE